MKVLITGGSGFIGSNAAEILSIMGHELFIIDDLSSGNADNLKNIEHTFYKLDIADKECEDVFRKHKPDIVIHLAAQVDVKTSMEQPYLDTRSNILGLVNMLSLSAGYGIKKFLFASSAAIYGNNQLVPLNEEEKPDPVSPYGMSKSMGEFYCNKWNQIYGLKTLCFRFSNVYGPKQGTIGEGGVVSIFMQRVLKGQPLYVFGDGDQTRDFIFVKDLAEAICKGIESDMCGVCNLSTNTESSVNQLLDILKSLYPVEEIIHQQPRPGDIYKSRLNNARITKALNWAPRFSFDEGIRETFRWFAGYIPK